MAQLAGSEKAFDILGLDPFDLDVGAVVEASVLQAFDDRQVGVGKLDVLANQTDPDRLHGGFDLLHELLPVREVDVAFDPQHVAHEVVEALVVQDQRQLVDVVRVGGIDDGAQFDVAHGRDLALQVVAQRLLAAAHDHIGLDAAAAELGHRVLGRLGLLLASWADERHQRHVDVADVVAADHVAELADCFEEREDLDVADRAADLGDDDVDIVARHPLNPAFDFVGDVRDDLNGLAEVVAASFSSEHGLVDRAGGGIRVARQVLVDEALVVTEVEVRLAAVIGDEDLTVLERVHRARVDVDVRVELLERDAQATVLQQPTE